MEPTRFVGGRETTKAHTQKTSSRSFKIKHQEKIH